MSLLSHRYANVGSFSNFSLSIYDKYLIPGSSLCFAHTSQYRVLLNISNITITEYCQRTVFVILTKGWLLVNITKVMTIKSCRFKSVKKSLLIKCCKKHAFDIITFSRSLLYCEIVIVITLS